MSRQRSNETLKKQINYVNYTRQNFDSVSQHRLNQVYQKLNQCRAFDRMQKRPMSYLEMQEHEKRLNRSTQNATRLAPKNPHNLEQMRELLNSSLKQVEAGQISVLEFNRRTKPLIEQQDFESQMRVNQNIRSIHNRRRTESQLYSNANKKAASSMFDAESVKKRRKRLE